MANLYNFFNRSVLRPPSPSFLRPFQPALESESESTVCVDPQHAMATLLQEFMSGVGKHGIGIEKQCPILNFIMQYCNFPEFVINKMGHCFSNFIPCPIPIPDIHAMIHIYMRFRGFLKRVECASSSSRFLLLPVDGFESSYLQVQESIFLSLHRVPVFPIVVSVLSLIIVDVRRSL